MFNSVWDKCPLIKAVMFYGVVEGVGWGAGRELQTSYRMKGLHCLGQPDRRLHHVSLYDTNFMHQIYLQDHKLSHKLNHKTILELQNTICLMDVW